MKIHKTIQFILLFTFLAMMGCSKNASDIPLKDIEKHRMYQDENGIENVKYEYQKLLENYPDSEIAYYLLARCEKTDLKSLHLNRSLEINPEFYYSLVGLGVIYNNQSDYDKAESYYKKAIKIEGMNYLAYNNLYALYIEKATKENNSAFKIKYYQDAISALKSADIANKGYDEFKEQDDQYYVKKISALESQISDTRKIRENQEQGREIQDQQRIQRDINCSRYSHESFLRERFDNLGYTILSIQLNSNSDCAYQWLVQTIDKYGIDRFCSVNTKLVSGEIEVTNAKCK